MLPPNIHFIQRGWFNSNHILIRGDEGVVLVDTGHRQDVAETLDLVFAAPCFYDLSNDGAAHLPL